MITFAKLYDCFIIIIIIIIIIIKLLKLSGMITYKNPMCTLKHCLFEYNDKAKEYGSILLVIL